MHPPVIHFTRVSSQNKIKKVNWLACSEWSEVFDQKSLDHIPLVKKYLECFSRQLTVLNFKYKESNYSFRKSSEFYYLLWDDMRWFGLLMKMFIFWRQFLWLERDLFYFIGGNLLTPVGWNIVDLQHYFSSICHCLGEKDRI